MREDSLRCRDGLIKIVCGTAPRTDAPKIARFPRNKRIIKFHELDDRRFLAQSTYQFKDLIKRKVFPEHKVVNQC